MTNAAVEERVQKQQEALERQRKELEEYERLKGFDFLRALYEMACSGVKK